MSASETLVKGEQLSEPVSCRQSCKDMFLCIFGNHLLQTQMQTIEVIEFRTENAGQYIQHVPVTTSKERETEFITMNTKGCLQYLNHFVDF